MEDRTIIYIILILLSLVFVTLSFGTTEEEKEIQKGVLVEHSIELKDGRNVTCVTINKENTHRELSCDWEHAK